MKHRLIDSKGRPLSLWQARMLADGDRAVRFPTDTFWADMRARTTILVADLATAEQEADQLILDLTRAQMAGER